MSGEGAIGSGGQGRRCPRAIGFGSTKKFGLSYQQALKFDQEFVPTASKTGQGFKRHFSMRIVSSRAHGQHRTPTLANPRSWFAHHRLGERLGVRARSVLGSLHHEYLPVPALA